jgi:predicted nucleic acid-binding protein
MRYWDASAIVPLVVAESTTDRVRAWLREDPDIVTWGWTRVELASAVERRAREGVLDRARRRRVLDAFGELARAWDEVTDLIAVRTKAQALLARHSLRAADAGQLAAALLVAGDEPGFTFVCLDERLGQAAELEGLRPLGA